MEQFCELARCVPESRSTMRPDESYLRFAAEPEFAQMPQTRRPVRNMQLINVNAVQTQPLQAPLNGLAEVCGRRIVGPLIRAGTVPASLSRNYEIRRTASAVLRSLGCPQMPSPVRRIAPKPRRCTEISPSSETFPAAIAENSFLFTIASKILIFHFSSRSNVSSLRPLNAHGN
jgi:hypothetical protein